MNELDHMIQDKDRILNYWKGRVEHEREINRAKSHDITITVTTLEWFLWMIESAGGKCEL